MCDVDTHIDHNDLSPIRSISLSLSLALSLSAFLHICRRYANTRQACFSDSSSHRRRIFSVSLGGLLFEKLFLVDYAPYSGLALIPAAYLIPSDVSPLNTRIHVEILTVSQQRYVGHNYFLDFPAYRNPVFRLLYLFYVTLPDYDIDAISCIRFLVLIARHARAGQLLSLARSFNAQECGTIDAA